MIFIRRNPNSETPLARVSHTTQLSCSNINKRSDEGAKQFYKMARTMHESLKSDDLEVTCSILEDETNKSQVADDFIVSLLKMQDN